MPSQPRRSFRPVVSRLARSRGCAVAVVLVHQARKRSWTMKFQSLRLSSSRCHPHPSTGVFRPGCPALMLLLARARASSCLGYGDRAVRAQRPVWPPEPQLARTSSAGRARVATSTGRRALARPDRTQEDAPPFCCRRVHNAASPGTRTSSTRNLAGAGQQLRARSTGSPRPAKSPRRRTPAVERLEASVRRNPSCTFALARRPRASLGAEASSTTSATLRNVLNRGVGGLAQSLARGGRSLTGLLPGAASGLPAAPLTLARRLQGLTGPGQAPASWSPLPLRGRMTRLQVTSNGGGIRGSAQHRV